MNNDETYKDITFGMSQNGNVRIASPAEHVRNVIYRLFHMVPGDDINDFNMGLNISGKNFDTHVDHNRDIDYENEITRQILAYTDFEPRNVMAYYEGNYLLVALEVQYNGSVYALEISSDPTSLTNVLRRG